MSVQRTNYRERSAKRSRQPALVFAVICLSLLCVVLLCVLLFGGNTSDRSLYNTLVDRVLLEEEAARTTSALLSRTGGSTTMNLIGKTRQHLYALGQLNDLSATLLSNQALVPQEAITLALEALDACIARLLEGQAIDAQLSSLWAQISVIEVAVEVLRG